MFQPKLKNDWTVFEGEKKCFNKKKHDMYHLYIPEERMSWTADWSVLLKGSTEIKLLDQCYSLMTDKTLPNLFYTNELLFKRSLSFRDTCWIIYRLNGVSETCSKIIGDSGYNHSWSIRVVMSLVGDELIEVNYIVPLLCMSLNFQNKVAGFF